MPIAKTRKDDRLSDKMSITFFLTATNFNNNINNDNDATIALITKKA